MTGFYLLFVAALWLAFVVWFSKTVTKKLPMDTWRVPVALAVFAAVLPLPLLDEIVAGRQFEQLCKDNAEIQVNRVTAAGKTVYFDSQPRIEVEGTWVRVVLQPYRYIDATTRETVVSYNELLASGGRFIHMLGISEGGMPLTFRGTCVPANRPASIQTFKSFGINYIEPPLTKKGN